VRASQAHGPRWAAPFALRAVKPRVAAPAPLKSGSGFHFRGSCSNAIVIFPKAFAKAVAPANITEKKMRYRLTLAVVAAFVGGSSIAAHAQAPAVVIPRASPAPALATEQGRQAPAPGTGMATGGRGAGGHSAGTGGIASGVGTGGILGTTRAGTGGLKDNATGGSSTGGIND
jgi:hypothetical protein